MKTIRNDADRKALLERVTKLTGDEKPAWGKMTCPQMISHLVQTGALPFAATLPDNSNFMSRNILKPLVLYVLPMPKEVKVSPEMDQQQAGRKPEAFLDDRQKVCDAFEALAKLDDKHECQYHPFFGKLTPKEWGVLAHKHADHHLRQFGV